MNKPVNLPVVEKFECLRIITDNADGTFSSYYTTEGEYITSVREEV